MLTFHWSPYKHNMDYVLQHNNNLWLQAQINVDSTRCKLVPELIDITHWHNWMNLFKKFFHELVAAGGHVKCHRFTGFIVVTLRLFPQQQNECSGSSTFTFIPILITRTCKPWLWLFLKPDFTGLTSSKPGFDIWSVICQWKTCKCVCVLSTNSYGVVRWN